MSAAYAGTQLLPFALEGIRKAATPQRAVELIHSIVYALTHPFLHHFIPFYALVWGVEPDVTHQTSWLGSTDECGVPKTKLVRILLRQERNVPLLVVL